MAQMRQMWQTSRGDQQKLPPQRNQNYVPILQEHRLKKIQKTCYCEVNSVAKTESFLKKLFKSKKDNREANASQK
jgi:hypothetical protein